MMPDFARSSSVSGCVLEISDSTFDRCNSASSVLAENKSDIVIGRCKSASSLLAGNKPDIVACSKKFGSLAASETMHGYVCHAPSLHSQIDNGLKRLLRIENNSAFEEHPLVNAFITTYQALPIAARAKVENWLISMDDIKAPPQDIGESGTYQATYHGAEVSVAKHANIGSQDDGEAHCLQTEIRAMAQLRHPNIVCFLGANVCSEAWTVVTERMPTGSVRSLYLSKQAQQPAWRPSTHRALAWALDLARAVTYLHHSDPSVTHRDLRPDTLFIASSGALKIAGFRRCALLPFAARSSGAPVAGPAAGQAPCVGASISDSGEGKAAAREAVYAAPELVRDGALTDPAVDIYAAAAVISYLRTGRDPARRSRSPPTAGCLARLRLPDHQGGWGCRAGAVLATAAAWDPAERPAADGLLDALEAAAARSGCGACRVS